MVDQAEQERSRTVKISFGTVFVLRDDGAALDNKHVITDIEEGDLISAAKIIEDKDGRYFALTGTLHTYDFGARVGQMSIAEVISALKLGWKKAGIGSVKENIVVGLLKSSHKGSRTIRIMDS